MCKKEIKAQTNLSKGFDNFHSYEIPSGKEGVSIHLLPKN
jgi:hypothetical protein